MTRTGTPKGRPGRSPRRKARRTYLRVLIAVIVLICLLPLGVIGYAYWEATWDPVVRRADVAVADWPRGEPARTVLLISDTHVSKPDMTPDRLERALAKLDGLKPDLVLLAGDYIGHNVTTTFNYDPEDIVAPFARLHAPLGIVAVLGNHDTAHGAGGIRRALEAEHIAVLTNQALRRGPFVIGGLGDGFTQQSGPAETGKAMDALGPGARIIVNHSPDVAFLLRFKVDAILAGHTHCGQFVLPFYGPIVRREDRFRWLTCGRSEIFGMNLFVTSGLGTSYLPLRLGARPDVWLIRFGPKH